MSHQRSAALHATLRADAVPTEAPVRVERSSVPLDASPSAGERRVRVGAAHATDLRVEFATLSPRHLNATPRKVARGAIRETASGGFVWTGVVETPGAAAMRLRFSNFFLPRNGEL